MSSGTGLATTNLAVVAYPVLTDADSAMIQTLRARHDPQFALLGPHITLVFPVQACASEVIGEVRAAAQAFHAFQITLRSARAVRDEVAGGGHVWLVLEEGAPEMVALHRRLYAGHLSWAKRTDIPYFPHLTVAASTNFRECEVLAGHFPGEQIAVSGSVDTLTVVRVDAAMVTTVASIALRPTP